MKKNRSKGSFSAMKKLTAEVMEALARTIDAKDKYTNGHSERVAIYSRMLAKNLGLPAAEQEKAYYMGLLHDIGKIGIPNEIINKTTGLTNEEFQLMQSHPILGYEILKNIKSMPELAQGARWHHEFYDGNGYPDGVSGKQIPLLVRIVAVADSYDAMTSNRSYRRYLPQETARREIEMNIGTQFDPVVAECMLDIIDGDSAYSLHE
ncbi:MAG: HD-GYP domain-containing protein [Ruminiclostridium sp.]|nr:HD-GYP domain-containing protein [Ruminiclostridium sp.]